MTTTPHTVVRVAPVAGGDLDHQLGALASLPGISDHLASIDSRLGAVARAARLAAVAGGVVTGAVVVAATALVVGEVRR